MRKPGTFALEKKVHKGKGKKTKTEILAETYGCFQSTKSADEIIEEIYNSRHFVDKNQTPQRITLDNSRGGQLVFYREGED